MPSSSNAPRRTLLLTGASRGIGHATAIRFSSAGWRVITCSRHAFPEVCPWGAGPEDHIEVDLGNPDDTTRAIPIFVLTAHALVGDRERALAAGCDEFETKPIDFTRLVGKLQHLFQQH